MISLSDAEVCFHRNQKIGLWNSKGYSFGLGKLLHRIWKIVHPNHKIVPLETEDCSIRIRMIALLDPELLSSFHGLSNYIDTKAKRRHLKKFTCKGTLRQVFLCLRHPPYLWHHTGPRTVYVYTVYLFTQGRGERGGRVEPERKLDGQQFTKLGRKYQHDCLYLQSINSD
jgi:hypothetical protein